jgi:hypothetical protein
MPRKGPVPKRDVLPDPIYNSQVFTNNNKLHSKRVQQIRFLIHHHFPSIDNLNLY